MTNYRDTLYSNYYSTQIEATVADESWTETIFSHEILPHLRGLEDKRWVELGCGHGNLLKFLQKKGFKDLQGCDLSEEQISIAKKSGFQVVQQDALTFLNTVENVDGVVAIDVLEHLTKDEAVVLLKQVNFHLSLGGKLVIRVPNADAATGSSFLWSDFTHELFLNAASARQLFQSCGFKKVEVWGSYSKARGWKRFFSSPLRALIELRMKLFYLAYGVGTKGKIWTPNLIIVAEKS